MNLDSRIPYKDSIGILYPFLGHLIRDEAAKRFNNKETALFCQDYTGVNNSG